MAIEIFNRYEKKYLVGEEVFHALQGKLAERMDLDGHNQSRLTYPICNIYYDTDDSRLIRASLAKPLYKEKLRLRSYGTPTEGNTVYVEIKKKFNGKVNKRRSGMKPQEAREFLSTGRLPIIQPYMNAQVLREVQYMLTRTPLKPAVYLSYERRAFKGEADLRVSFDTDILTRRSDLRLESGAYGEPLLPRGVWLMEIKTAGAIPLWLSRLLAEYGAMPRGFSKYGFEYQKNEARREKQCLSQFSTAI
ncbi:MAG: polyphosphate polymerase domain-containing protein [Clostridiales Family XIII bacterium]|nr:polyphosphate polymerase domain-containing protein [Clostridiales Family XIII bacterium]